jgi:hypothetical protein
MPAKRYKVTLTDEERQDLLALISKVPKQTARQAILAGAGILTLSKL